MRKTNQRQARYETRTRLRNKKIPHTYSKKALHAKNETKPKRRVALIFLPYELEIIKKDNKNLIDLQIHPAWI